MDVERTAAPVDAQPIDMAGRAARRDARGCDAVAATLVADVGQRLRDNRSATIIAVMLSRLDLANAAYRRDRVDAAIAALSTRIVAAIGGNTLVTRGDDGMLLVVLDGDRPADASAAVTSALAGTFVDGEGRVLLGGRAGIAADRAGADPVSLISRARDALAAARMGGGVVRIATPDSIAALDRLAADLHLAVGRGEIDIVFQPQVEIATGRITGVEALARWSHPVQGPLGADTLFAAADRADLCLALSDHVQELALARAAAWPRSLGHLRLSLNVMPADIARAGFAASFLGRVDASGFPRGRLTVELTETGMIQELSHAAALLAQLRGAGCRVAIDDFGTGYSSLAWLKSLPLDYIKIDKALARDIDGDPRDRVVIRGVIDIAHALGLAVIAEGVETPQQLALLKAEGCGWYQGFLRAGGLDAAALARMVERE